MGLRSFFRSRWFNIPSLVIFLLALAAVGYLGNQLRTITPAMYNTRWWVDFLRERSAICSGRRKCRHLEVRSDGTGAVNLTADCNANDSFPDVSGDGEWIVFRSGRNGKKGSGRKGNKEIYLMDKDGGHLRRISKSEGNDTMPAISPDGKWVVYVTDRSGYGLKLWIQSLEDPNDNGHLLEPTRANLTGFDMHPRFSPDGKWVVFTSDRSGLMDEWFLSGRFPQPYGELYALPVNGSGAAVRLTDDKWEDSLAFWGKPYSAAKVEAIARSK